MEAGEETIVELKLLNKYNDDKFLIQSVSADENSDCSALDVVGLEMLYRIFSIHNPSGVKLEKKTFLVQSSSAIFQ